MNERIREQILATLEGRQPRAAFVAEIVAGAASVACPQEVQNALLELSRQGRVLITDRPAPEVHLASTDLSIVAPVPEQAQEGVALAATECLWEEWLRAFLSTHRCQYQPP